MEKNSLKRKISILVIMMTFLISACQSLPLLSPEQVLQNRVTSMMTARVAQNWAAVYDYLNPDYKHKVSKQSFVNMKREIVFSDFAVESVKISPSGKDSVIIVQYDMTVMTFDVADHRETQNWVKEGGMWYYQMNTDSIMDKE